MREFQGFPSEVRYTGVPSLFFTTLLPQIDDLAELKVTLHLFWLLGRKRGLPRVVTYQELAADRTLLRGLGALNQDPAQALKRGLQAAEQRGTLLALDWEGDRAYLLNHQSDKGALARLEGKERPSPSLATPSAPEAPPPERANIFTLYEECIGLLNPLIAEELKEAEDLYPASWIEDAFREAVSLNRRNWRSISHTLERWAREGREDGKPARDSRKMALQEEFHRKYGHLIRH